MHFDDTPWTTVNFSVISINHLMMNQLNLWSQMNAKWLYVLPTYDVFVIGNVIIAEFLHWEVAERRFTGQLWKGFPWANQAHPPLGTNKRCFRCECFCYKGIAKLQKRRQKHLCMMPRHLYPQKGMYETDDRELTEEKLASTVPFFTVWNTS